MHSLIAFAKGAGALGSLGLLLLACNGRLAVLEPAVGGDAGSNGSGGSSGELDQADAGPVEGMPEPSPCACGNSDPLLALGCGVATYGAPVISDDGDTIAFTVCDAASVCQPHVWRAGVGVRAVPGKLGYAVVDLSPDGSNALLAPTESGSSEPALYQVDDGTLTSVGLSSEPVLSADGSVFGLHQEPDTDPQLARWSRGSGTELLGVVPGGQMRLLGARGAAVVLGAELVGGALFRWTPADGLVIEPEGLPRIAGNSPLALSRDGSALAAYLPGTGPDVRAVHIRGTTVTEVATSERGSMSPLLLSADGSVLALSRHLSGDAPSCGQNPLACEQFYEGVCWSEASEAPFPADPAPLPNLLSVMSADGSRMVGKVTTNIPRLHTWSKERGPRDLLGDLEAAGVDLSDWELDVPHGMSADGRVVTGYGRCGTGTSVYRLVLPD